MAEEEDQDPSPMKAPPFPDDDKAKEENSANQPERKKMQRRVSPIVFDIRHTQASPLTLDDPLTS